MKVLNLMLSACSGGLESVAYQYARVLAEAGCESVMIVSRRSHYVPPDGVRIHRLAGSSLVNPANALGILRILRKERPDVVLGHGGRGVSFCTLPFIRRIAPKGIRYVGVLHGENARRFRRMDRVLAVSETLRGETIAKYGIPADRIVACPNAVAVPPETALVPLPVLRDGIAPTIGFLGRFDVCKGLDVLIDACAELRRRGFAFRLEIGGDGPERRDLVRRVERVGISTVTHWAGWVDDRDAFFGGIDILAMPSREEAVGLVALEAMAHGRAVVVSDCPGPKAIVEPAAAGVVVPRESPSALADALGRCLADRGRLVMMGGRGRACVKAKYSETILAERILKAISP